MSRLLVLAFATLVAGCDDVGLTAKQRSEVDDMIPRGVADADYAVATRESLDDLRSTVEQQKIVIDDLERRVRQLERLDEATGADLQNFLDHYNRHLRENHR